MNHPGHLLSSSFQMTPAPAATRQPEHERSQLTPSTHKAEANYAARHNQKRMPRAAKGSLTFQKWVFCNLWQHGE